MAKQFVAVVSDVNQATCFEDYTKAQAELNFDRGIVCPRGRFVNEACA